jgi:RNA polymerase sigma-54 factor
MDTRLAFQTQLTVSPQLLMINRLLSLPGAEMESFLGQELAENPALELASQPRLLAGSDHMPAAHEGLDSLIERIPAREPALDQLLSQLDVLAEGPDRDLASHLLHRLDARGYLDVAPEEAAAELGVSLADLERARQLLHQLEPAGIGARDLRECLLIQCGQLEGDGDERRLLRRMLEECWEECVGHRWRAVARHLGVSPQAVAASWRYLRCHCYPHPLTLMADDSPQEGLLACPDLIIRFEPDGQPAYRLEIPGAERFELRLSAVFERAWRAAGAARGREVTPVQQAWVAAWLERARMFITAFNQRWATLDRIGQALIRQQEAFLEAGPHCLKPMTQADLAAELGLNESTISRAVSGKIVQLPDGRLRPLADLFDPSLAAKEAIRRLLARSKGPLTDREIAACLEGEGIPLARRTVAKYRQQMRLNSSHHDRPLLQQG